VDFAFCAYRIESIGFLGEEGRPVKDIIIIGGPNGAGKSTSAPAIIPRRLEVREFVNADEIARGLSPFNPEGAAVAAGRLLVERIQMLVRDGESFAFETTCAGRAHAHWLRECKMQGWRVTLIFLWLPTPEAALDRVARRVRDGGHDIPKDVVIRRWKAGAANMRNIYLPLSDLAMIYDNSDGNRVLIAERTVDVPLVVHDTGRWAMIERASK
jgi:predicted ABC-type ATPase